MKIRLHSGQRGQTAVMFTIGATTMFGMLGLVVDIGYAYYRKTVAQAAAQAAAVSAVKAAYDQSAGTITCGSNHVLCQATATACPPNIGGFGSDNLEKGCLYATANGFGHGERQWVTLESGTGSVNGVTVAYYVTAKAGERLPQLFSAVLGNTEAMLVARSTVGYIPASGGGCIYVLNPTVVSLTMNGNTILQTGCGMYVNSNNPGAITFSGTNASITATGGSKVNVVGNVDYGPNGSAISPAPIVGAPSTGDPLAGMDPPTDGTCQSGFNVTNHATTTIDPGTYCGDIRVSGTLNLNPGMYIVKGTSSGGLTVTGQGTLSGSGVSFYFETGTVNFAGGASVNLSAPTSGIWQGVLMFQARGNTQAASLVGGSSQLTSGILYFPNAQLSYKGGSSSVVQNATIISDTLNLVGNSYFNASATTPYLNTVSGVVVLE